MKKLSLKAFVLFMVVMMGLTLVPSLYAAERYENAPGRTPENVDVACSIYSDKKTLEPGDQVTVSVDVTKMPDNGFGICAFSMRLCYDADQLTLNKTTVGSREYNAIFPGEVGTALGLETGNAALADEPGMDGYKRITVAFYKDAAYANATEPGNVFKATFTVNDDASGDVDVFLITDEKMESNDDGNGFAVSGIQELPGKGYAADTAVSYYVDTQGLEGMEVPVPLEGIKFSDSLENINLDKTTNKSFDLSSYVELIPSNTTEDDDLEWSEDSNGAVVTVANGVVTAVGNGTANVTVRCGNFSDTIPVNVTTSVSSLSFANTNYVVNFEETRDLGDELTVNPTDAEYESIEWSSDNNEVATVNSDGVVTGVAKGTANITARIGNVSKTVAVTVAVPLKSVTLSADTITVYKGKSDTVVVTPQPKGAVWETIEASLNSGAEFVEVKEVENGVQITGIKEGNAVVAISVDGNQTGDLYKLVNVQVKENRVTSATITNEDGAELLRGETLEMKGEFAVEDPAVDPTDDTTMTWESLNPEVATIDEKGVVTAVKEGTATIKLTVAGHSDEYVVTVKEIHVDGVVISEDTLKELEELESLTVGDTLKVPFTVTPEGTITDTVDEILDFINVEYDEKLVDVTVEYDKETGKGVITITVKAAGEASVVVSTEATSEEPAYEFVLNCVEKVVEQPEENVDTGDMPVAMLAIVMAMSVAGIVASKKIFVK